MSRTQRFANRSRTQPLSLQVQWLEPRLALDAAAAGFGSMTGWTGTGSGETSVTFTTAAQVAGPGTNGFQAVAGPEQFAAQPTPSDEALCVVCKLSIPSTRAVSSQRGLAETGSDDTVLAVGPNPAPAEVPSAASTPDTEARSIGEILAEFRAAQNGLLEGYRLFQSGDAAAASLTLQQAQAVLDGVKDDLVHPSVAEALGRKLTTALRRTGVFQERIRGAQSYVERGVTKARVVLGKVTGAWKFGQRTANLIGRPILALRENSAGFYASGKTATFRFAMPEGCTDPPVVTVENVFDRSALDTANVVVDEARGLIRVPMGWQSGAGRVTVSRCGCGTPACASETMLLYNKGPSLPDNFPSNVQRGLYRVSFSVDGGPSIRAGTARLTNVISFAGRLQRIINRAVSAFQLPGECTKSVAWLPATDNRFGYTFTITCTVEGQTVSTTASFLIERV